MRHFFSVALILTTIPSIVAAHAGKRQYVSGTMLDASEYDWCHHDCDPFDRPAFFYCVKTANELLTGSHKVDWVWQKDSSKMVAPAGRQVSVRYDRDSFWIVRTDGKDMRVTRDYSQDVFTNAECTAEIHRHWLSELGHVQRPATVPAQAVIVPQGPRSSLGRAGPYFWVMCTFNAGSLWDLCDSWDEKGNKLAELECVSSSTHQAVVQKGLAVDPLTTRVYYEIHLRDSTVLTDWAKGRIDDKPAPGSILPKPIRNQN
jgi:hypothetical protein